MKYETDFLRSLIPPDFAVHHLVDDDCESLWITRMDGASFCRFYWYHYNPDTLVIDNLSVEQSRRRKGLGGNLLNLFESVARSMGKPTLMLWVEEGSFMAAWYARKGYEVGDRYEKPGFIWMVKSIAIR